MNKNNKSKNIKFAILATDVVLFAIDQNELKVLLIKIANNPFYSNELALPGGLILPEETAEDSVFRHMRSKAKIEKTYIEQLYTFSSIKRDPRGRVVSVAYIGLIPKCNTDKNIKWVSIKKIPTLAYDHNEIIKKAIERLKTKIEYTTIIQGLLPKDFTLSDLQNTYEIILNKKYDKRNFRKKILSLGFLKPIGKKRKGEPYRPADLYQFISKPDQVFNIL